MAIKCNNQLFVLSHNGNENELKKFKNNVQSNDSKECFALESLIPPPEEAGREWYEENWGTGSARESCLLYQNNEILNYHFVTYDFSPAKWLKNIAPQYLDLFFFMKFIREGNSSFGACIVIDDKYDYIDLDDASFLNLMVNLSEAGSQFSEDKIRMFKFNIRRCNPIFDLLFGSNKQMKEVSDSPFIMV